MNNPGYFLSVRKGPRHKSRCPHASVKELRLVDYGDISDEAPRKLMID
jgi:hypothetical protein